MNNFRYEVKDREELDSLIAAISLVSAHTDQPVTVGVESGCVLLTGPGAGHVSIRDVTSARFGKGGVLLDKGGYTFLIKKDSL